MCLISFSLVLLFILNKNENQFFLSRRNGNSQESSMGDAMTTQQKVNNTLFLSEQNTTAKSLDAGIRLHMRKIKNI